MTTLKEAIANAKLMSFDVTVVEGDNPTAAWIFTCMAESFEHAEEQAEDAMSPDAIVTRIDLRSNFADEATRYGEINAHD